MKWLLGLVLFSSVAVAQQDPAWFNRHEAAFQAHELAGSWYDFHNRVTILLGSQHQFSLEVQEAYDEVDHLHEDIELPAAFSHIAYGEDHYYRTTYQQVVRDYHYLNLHDAYLEQIGQQIDQRSHDLDHSFHASPPPPPAHYWCLAADNGFEEHWVRLPNGQYTQGHLGYGQSQWQAQNSALAACRQIHGSCVVRSCGLVTVTFSE